MVGGSAGDADFLDALALAGGERCLVVSNPKASLKAIIALDSLALGPALGGIRTLQYESERDALRDAVRLASAMTLKCAIAGLDAGGGKAVVMADPAMDREAAFCALGAYIEELGGLYRAGGDLGTTERDLAAAASKTRFVETNATELSEAAGLGVLRCIEACAERAARGPLRYLRVAVQGCGGMGAAVARALAEAGVDLVVADIDPAKARGLAEEVGADVIDPAAALLADVDIVAPCATGDVIDETVARQMQAWAICGAANNQMADLGAEEVLRQRGILWVPDFISSAGAVIRGAARQGLCAMEWRAAIDELGVTTGALFARSEREGRPMRFLAEETARRRIWARRKGAPGGDA
jgi:leucine dehydrogenase